jgi:autotransporter translocation and assembly factor TamB
VLERTASDPYATEATEISQRAPEGPVAATPSVFGGLDLNVALSIPSNLVLRGSDLRPANAPISIGDVNVTVGGLVQVRKPRGETAVRILGEVNTVRGNYDFQGRRFELMRDGRIRFQGADEINPLLDLRARREISGVETFVRVQGTMRQPELSFSSNPPLDEADILALIVFNAPMSELGEGQQVSLAERAGALAGGYVASGLARSIGNALELDQFEIEAQGDTGGPTLTVGEQVGEKLFFRVRQGFGAAQGTEFILEYQIADYLRFQGSVAETAGGAQRQMFRRVERGGLDVIFFFSY